MGKLISIIIPAYARSDLLGRLLDSIAAFTVLEGGIEILVIDDGTPNDRIAKCTRRHEVRLITNKTNMGIAATRNIGIEASCGKYICQMDADTVVSPRWLTKLMQSMERWDDKNCFVAVTAALLTCQVGYFMERPRSPLNPFNLIQVESVGTACTLYPRWIVDVIGGYDEDLFNLWSDMDFCKRLNSRTDDIKKVDNRVPKVVIDPMTVCFHHGWVDPATGEMKEETERNTRSLKALNTVEYRRKHLNSMKIMKNRWGVEHPLLNKYSIELDGENIS